MSPRCSQRVAVMSDESAELMQLDPERHVTARSCVELRHAGATADERRSLLVLTLVHAVHAAHTCASCVVYAAALSAVIRPHYGNGRAILKLLSITRLIRDSMQKARAQSLRCRGATRANACPPSPSFTVTLCVRTTNLIARPRLCTSQVSSQASRACVTGYVRAAMGARSHGWAAANL